MTCVPGKVTNVQTCVSLESIVLVQRLDGCVIGGFKYLVLSIEVEY